MDHFEYQELERISKIINNLEKARVELKLKDQTIRRLEYEEHVSEIESELDDLKKEQKKHLDHGSSDPYFLKQLNIIQQNIVINSELRQFITNLAQNRISLTELIDLNKKYQAK